MSAEKIRDLGLALHCSHTMLKRLTMLARTSGGTAGPDAELMAACDEAERLIISRSHGVDDRGGER